LSIAGLFWRRCELRPELQEVLATGGSATAARRGAGDVHVEPQLSGTTTTDQKLIKVDIPQNSKR